MLIEFTSFENEQFGTVRATMIDNKPWFAAEDVCRALDIPSLSEALKRLDEDEKMTIGSNEGQYSLSIVNTVGLHYMISGLGKPEVKAFRHWITFEVIPAVRKMNVMSVAEQLIAHAQLLLEHDQRLDALEKRHNEMEKRIEGLEAKMNKRRSITEESLCLVLSLVSKELMDPETGKSECPDCTCG